MADKPKLHVASPHDVGNPTGRWHYTLTIEGYAENIPNAAILQAVLTQQTNMCLALSALVVQISVKAEPATIIPARGVPT